MDPRPDLETAPRRGCGALPEQRDRARLLPRPRQPARPDLGVRHLGPGRPGEPRVARRRRSASTATPTCRWPGSTATARIEADRARAGLDVPPRRPARVLLNPGSVGQPRDGDPRGELAGARHATRASRPGIGSPTTSRPSRRAMLDAGLPGRAGRSTPARPVTHRRRDRRSAPAPGPQAGRPAGPRRAAPCRPLPLDRAGPADREGGGLGPTTPSGPPLRPAEGDPPRPAARVARRRSASACRRRRRWRSSARTRSARRAYATEEILRVLILGGVAALAWGLWVSVAIAVLLIAVAISYRQICIAYPTGGGSYSVSKRNFGRQVSLIAASALMIDYVMTVAVSTSSSIEQVTSAVPGADRRAGHPRRPRDRPDHDRQPPRAARGRQHLRDPDLPVPRLGAADDRDRVRSGSSSSASTGDVQRRSGAAGRRERPGARRCSCSCGRSRPAPWP